MERWTASAAAALALTKEDYAAARQELQQLRTSSALPDQFHAAVEMLWGIVLSGEEDYEAAMTRLDNARRLNSDAPVINYLRAVALLELNRHDEARRDADVCRHYVEYSIGVVTALNPVIGYDRATELAAEAMKTGRGIMELVRENKILTEQQIAQVLDPVTMTGESSR